MNKGKHRKKWDLGRGGSQWIGWVVRQCWFKEWGEVRVGKGLQDELQGDWDTTAMKQTSSDAYETVKESNTHPVGVSADGRKKQCNVWNYKVESLWDTLIASSVVMGEFRDPPNWLLQKAQNIPNTVKMQDIRWKKILRSILLIFFAGNIPITLWYTLNLCLPYCSCRLQCLSHHLP